MAPLGVPLAFPNPVVTSEEDATQNFEFLRAPLSFPYGKLSLAGTQSIPSSTPTVVSWNTVVHNGGGMATPTSAGLVAPVAGIYSVSSNLLCLNPVASSQRVDFQAFVNGSNSAFGPYTILDVTASTFIDIPISGDIKLAAGDVVNAALTQISGSAMTVGNAAGVFSVLSMHYVSAV